ncbi:MAG: 50S ribosomal protein L23 [Deltaproteobacteria bacterium GWC2_42_51]|nr:MAG: 50S ribosomal protein L23 [Deltaproteobacteria bacterium GWA2_42_85]OGP29822.1 MAG: 50S ribosomal protein L23 [Deltaproteobacteria bacterium GWB2_42_7]OGP32685.1 MAG: 50S ribosomal protein L23 [Deltaproteobacteria bacterium GWC2_42_51]OGP39124.1 MAG: 50S ribosomal protein L23 [Deltaproteobacteria bacterium GWD2_42_10]OGP47941.1 MAG: 50S ribosomal protein L23 [Deltaproteobacteria bacterium GWF2_42_12]OGQ24770.1 MAG: 50S ribosomal protein L23 [Deltaproteobacteria bacterium RIFCSPHIGHO2_0
MKDIYQILKEPVITEKSTTQRTESNKVVFWVDLKANKNDIKESVEKVFNVKVVNVNILRIPGKTKKVGINISKGSTRKKAYITLREGDSIPLFEGA